MGPGPAKRYGVPTQLRKLEKYVNILNEQFKNPKSSVKPMSIKEQEYKVEDPIKRNSSILACYYSFFKFNNVIIAPVSQAKSLGQMALRPPSSPNYMICFGVLEDV
jgi:hypothetical protein